jgi:Mrp family chromosome partitioning ATPase
MGLRPEGRPVVVLTDAVALVEIAARVPTVDAAFSGPATTTIAKEITQELGRLEPLARPAVPVRLELRVHLPQATIH